MYGNGSSIFRELGGVDVDNLFNRISGIKHSGDQHLSPNVPFSHTFAQMTYSPYKDVFIQSLRLYRFLAFFGVWTAEKVTPIVCFAFMSLLLYGY